MNFYKHFMGDYARATGHMSLVEHGAYRLMLDHFYGAGRPLPGDRKSLYRLLRAEKPDERRAVDTVALEFWRPLPAEIDRLYEWLDLHTAEERTPLQSVVCEWTEVGGLINVRALAEVIRASIVGAKNRKIAIDRETARRAQAANKGGES